MAEIHYSAKAALYIGLAELASGLISIGIGGFNTREEDHFAILHFKPSGLPVWAGVLVSNAQHEWPALFCFALERDVQIFTSVKLFDR